MIGRERRILLTGAGGFIGSHILSRLLSREDLDVCHQDGDSASQWSMDLETKGAIGRFVLQWKPDLVIHTAAVTSIAECEDDAVKFGDKAWEGMVEEAETTYTWFKHIEKIRELQEDIPTSLYC